MAHWSLSGATVAARPSPPPPAPAAPASPPDRPRPEDLVDLLGDVLADGLVGSVYQPVVDLVHGEVVGYEALARGPAGTPLESPAALFETATFAGRLVELDWACRIAALRGALDAGLTMRQTLFVNVEPSFLGQGVPAELEELERQAEQRLRLVFEFSERGLVDHPAALLAMVQAVRERSWGLAMDDVGVHPASSSLLPLVRPDVIKINHGVLSGANGALARGRVLHAAAAAAETTGTSLLLQGIESEEDVLEARGLGILLGQGYHLGRPGPLPRGTSTLPRAAVPLLRATPAPPVASPFELVDRAGLQVRRATPDALAAISHDLEELARTTHIDPVVIAIFQHADNFTRSIAWRYRELAESAAVVGVAGVGMEPEPTYGVRGVAIDPHDPLAEEWAVVVVSPYVNAALLAREVEDGGPDTGRRFDYVVTHDPALVVDAAEVLLRRVRPQAGR